MTTAKQPRARPSPPRRMPARRREELGHDLEALQRTWCPISSTSRCGAGRRHRRRPAAAGAAPPATRCCSTDARVALTLRLLGGLTTDEIARAFLVPEATIAQRITRAKQAARRGEGAVRGAARRRRSAERLESVLEVST